MSENNHPGQPDLSKYGPFEIGIDSPVSLTVEGNTGELIVKCFQGFGQSTQAVPMHFRFTNEAFAQLTRGILLLIDQGRITLNEGTQKPFQ